MTDADGCVPLSQTMTSPVTWTFVVADSDRIGGAERRLAEAIPLLLAAGDDVQVCTLTPPASRIAALLTQAGAEVTGVGRRLCRHPPEARHVVMTFGYRAGLTTRLRRPRGGNCVLWQSQTGLEPGRSRAVRTADRLTRSAVDLVVANSYAAADHVVTDAGFPPHRVVVVESGLPPEWTTAVPKGPGPPVVAMIGSERPMKNLAAGVRVFARLVRSATPGDPRTDQLRLAVYTDDATEVRLVATQQGVGDRLIVHERETVEPRDHAGFSALLHPSLSESLPRVVLEAIAQRTPVAAYDVGDTARWVTDPAPVGDEAALLDLLREAVLGDGRSPVREVRSTRSYVTELRRLAVASGG